MAHLRAERGRDTINGGSADRPEIRWMHEFQGRWNGIGHEVTRHGVIFKGLDIFNTKEVDNENIITYINIII